jgi:hypothetical protein
LENREKPVHQRNSPADDPKSHQLGSQNVDYHSSTSEKFTEFQKGSILFFLCGGSDRGRLFAKPG